MKRLRILPLILLATLTLAAPAAADEILTVAADSTMSGHAGWIIHSTESEGGMSLFFTEEAQKLRMYAVREYGSQTWEIPPTAQYLVPTVQMNIGDSWAGLGTDEGEATIARAAAQETITTAAGSFDCIRVDVEVAANPGVVVESYWFAWEVGFVRDQGYLGGEVDWRDELQSYTILGGTGYMPAFVGNTWNLAEITVPSENPSWGELKSLFR